MKLMTEEEFSKWWFDKGGQEKSENFFDEFLSEHQNFIDKQPSDHIDNKYAEALWELARKIFVEADF